MAEIENSGIEILKIINKKKTYVNANGKECPSYLYMVSVNGVNIAIKPVFNDGYSQLDVISRKVFK